MDEEAPLKTSEVARYCHVSPEVVALWIRNDKLNAYTTPGGHYRIPVREFVHFLEETGMPVPSHFKAHVRKCILVIDDEPLWVNFVIDALKDRYNVVGADNGIDGLVKIGTHHPDLVILDALMPGLNGCDVVRILHDDLEFKALKILVATGYPGESTVEEMKKIGVIGVLVKPVRLEELRTQVAAILAQ